MSSIADKLEAAAAGDAIALALVPVLAQPTGETGTGHPCLAPSAWDWLRDRVPHLLGMGPRVLDAAERLLAVRTQVSIEEAASLQHAAGVVRHVVLTAAITAPPDLWLLRHVLSSFATLGLLQRLGDGEAIDPESCTVRHNGELRTLHAAELDNDLQFLLARGLVEQYDDAYRIAGHPRVRALCAVAPLPKHWPASFTAVLRAAWSGTRLRVDEARWIRELFANVARRSDVTQTHWIADRDELELGYRLVPVVLSLRAAEKTAGLSEGTIVSAEDLCPTYPDTARGALEVLEAAGWVSGTSTFTVTTVGARGLARAPGPFGIIETYHPYMARGPEILLEGPQGVCVARSENVRASQDANRATFERANHALDAFCHDTGFRYRVFIEHAIGRGEATRQRFTLSGESVAYVGADLEDASIDAALEEQKRGRLPANMLFVRHVDIGEPAALIAALTAAQLDPRGAVMLVGNGFHEVGGQSDETMVEVFRGYHDAGILLLFTEESALCVDDLRATAWNTYHAGFRYVHDKSGQSLRPAEPLGRPTRVGRPLRAAWSECARRAGYVRLSKYSSHTRAIYPTIPRCGVNPAISVNHFVVPAPLAQKLRL